jgi:hypothetical protein
VNLEQQLPLRFGLLVLVIGDLIGFDSIDAASRLAQKKDDPTRRYEFALVKNIARADVMLASQSCASLAVWRP